MSGFVTGHIATCTMCGANVDTREEEAGGDPDGCEVVPGQWVCSRECDDAYAEWLDCELNVTLVS